MRSIISFVPVIKFNSFIQKIFLIKHLLIFLFSCSTCLYMLNITFGTLCFNFTQKQIKIKVFYKNTDCLIYHTLSTEEKIWTLFGLGSFVRRTQTHLSLNKFKDCLGGIRLLRNISSL